MTQWPKEIYVGLRNNDNTIIGRGCIQYCDDFVDPGIAPTWGAAITGLVANSTSVYKIDVDPFTPATKQYAIVDGPERRILYRRDNRGSWTAILTNAIAQAATGVAKNAGVLDFYLDDFVEGSLYAVMVYDNDTSVINHYALISTDWGASWTASATPFGTDYTFRDPTSVVGGDGWIYVTFYALQIRAYEITAGTWSNIGGSNVKLWYNPLEPTGVYSFNSGSDGLAFYTRAGSKTTLNTDTFWNAVEGAEMWFDQTDVNHQRLTNNVTLFYTDDRWSTYGSNSPANYVGWIPRVQPPDTDEVFGMTKTGAITMEPAVKLGEATPGDMVAIGLGSGVNDGRRNRITFVPPMPHVYAYDIVFEDAVENDLIHTFGVALEDAMPNDSVHTSDVVRE